jgi:serine/threonine-protein kinase HipA
MHRRESARARHEGVCPRTLTGWDFLLGFHDETRLGALRFKLPGGNYVDSDIKLAAPPLASLRELQAASLQFEQHLNEEEHPKYSKWLSQLIAPGRSLGGARPAASVRDERRSLCIAKFPIRQETRDVEPGSWWQTHPHVKLTLMVLAPGRFILPKAHSRLFSLKDLTALRKVDGSLDRPRQSGPVEVLVFGKI